jgi:heme/copper-type cytochrome/quinol oxidase subunit 1
LVFFLVPSIPATLGNFLVPLMIGARDLAFPKLNLLSWYVYMVGAIFTLYAVISGGVDTGWTFYAPFSSLYSQTHVVATALGVFITGFSSILTGLNFIVTIHKMRAPGMTWFRLPLFIWAMYATSVIFILGTPVIAITIFLLGLERLLHVGIFDPAVGGDPLLFQHLFWFYSHPAVYIMILPAMGVISEVVTCFSKKRIFGYSIVAFSSMAIAVISFLVWGHHMFVTGQSVYAGLIFSVLSFLVAIPSAIKVFNWTSTLYKGSISYEAPMLYALGFIGLFTMGGLTGLFLASLATDVHLSGTYFIVAHFHYIMVGGAVMGYLGGIHFWWPKITGRLVSRRLGALRGAGGVRRFQPDILPAIHAWLPRHAAALRRVPGRISSAQRDVLGGGVDSGRRISNSADLSDLVDALRAGGGSQSVGRTRARVGGAFPSADRKFRRDSCRYRRGLQLHRREANSWLIWLTPLIRQPWCISSRPRSSSTMLEASACGCSWPPKSCSSAAFSWHTSSISLCIWKRSFRAVISLM